MRRSREGAAQRPLPVFCPRPRSFSALLRWLGESPPSALPKALPFFAVTVGALLGLAMPPALPGCAVTVGTLAPAVGVVAVVAGVLGTALVGGAVVVGAAAVGARVTVVVPVAVAGPLSPASFTSAAASTPSASAATTAIAATGPFQFGVAASRVRAAAPQRRHQSCCGSRGAPHNGQASPVAGRPGGGPPGGIDAWGSPGGLAAGATLTTRARAGG